MNSDKDLKNKTLEELEETVLALDGKKYLAKYIFSFIHAKSAVEIADITTLSKDFRQKLTSAGFYISQLKTLEKHVDPDSTVKYLFELAGAIRVESVILTSKDRKTLCISCQAGCRMGCTFCATARLRFRRNLTAAEIVDQVNKVTDDAGVINNVVYMGMGEPLDNYDEVMRSLRILNHHAGKNIGARHLTISTCGIPEKIVKLADENLQVHLAISLHSTNDRKRAELMGAARKYPLKKLMQAIRKYQQITNRRVMFVYCMIEGVNDADAEARAIIKLLAGINANINLIEYNPHPECDFNTSTPERFQAFFDILMQGGIETTARYKRGQSIKAACGQLGATWPEYDAKK